MHKFSIEIPNTHKQQRQPYHIDSETATSFIPFYAPEQFFPYT